MSYNAAVPPVRSSPHARHFVTIAVAHSSLDAELSLHLITHPHSSSLDADLSLNLPQRMQHLGHDGRIAAAAAWVQLAWHADLVAQLLDALRQLL